MRIEHVGSGCRVHLSVQDIANFCRNWPASNLRGLSGVNFEFARNGDLVDIEYRNGSSEDWDGPALVALSQDAQQHAKRRGAL